MAKPHKTTAAAEAKSKPAITASRSSVLSSDLSSGTTDTSLRGHLDPLRNDVISGWLVDLNDPDNDYGIIAKIFEIELETKLTLPRVQLKDLVGYRRCGFRVALSELSDEYWRALQRSAIEWFQKTGANASNDEVELHKIVQIRVAKNGMDFDVAQLGVSTKKFVKTFIDIDNFVIGDSYDGISTRSNDKLGHFNKEREKPYTIAFYLPQYHPIPENDRWWGVGFTEWTNVPLAKPLFEGHYQPRVPTEFGYYDLRIIENFEKQASLALEYGIDGFCIYAYWFAGKKLLQKPLENLVQSKSIEIEFCLCWANENWTRRWDGQEEDVLISQIHNFANDKKFIEDYWEVLSDYRYIKVDNKPVILIYRPGLIMQPRETFDYWRLQARRRGFDGLYVIACCTFETIDPNEYGCDAAVQFPPHQLAYRECNEQVVKNLDPEFEGKVYNYDDLAAAAIRECRNTPWVLPGVTLGWDNTARRGKRAHIFNGATPEKYEGWLRTVSGIVASRDVPFKAVFVNAWNEWAEGTYLEPDVKFGRRWLEATGRAVADPTTVEEAFGSLKTLAIGDTIEQRHLDLIAAAESLSLAALGESRYLVGLGDAVSILRQLGERQSPVDIERLIFGANLLTIPPANSMLIIEHIGDLGGHRREQVLRSMLGLRISGWYWLDSVIFDDKALVAIVLSPRDGKGSLCFPVGRYIRRPDVASHMASSSGRQPDIDSNDLCGFHVIIDLTTLEPGEYSIGLLRVKDALASILSATDRIYVS